VLLVDEVDLAAVVADAAALVAAAAVASAADALVAVVDSAAAVDVPAAVVANNSVSRFSISRAGRRTENIYLC